MPIWNPDEFLQRYLCREISDEKLNMPDILKEENRSMSLIRTITLVAGAHIIMTLTDGATLSFGIFLNDFADELSVGLGVIGAASSLLTSVLHLFSPVCAYIATKIGYRRTMIGTLLLAFGFMLSSQVWGTWQLFVSHSLITGFGISLVYTNTVAYVGLACDKHISIANGVTTAGTAVGWIVMPILINVLRGVYGWRGSLLLLGAGVLHATILSLILFRSPRTKSKSKISERKHSEEKLDEEDIMEVCSDEVEDNEESSADIQPIKTKAELLKVYLRLPITYPLFGFLIIVANLTFVAFSGTLYHLVSSAIKRGIPEPKATLLITVYGIGNIICRMFHGVPIKLKLITSNNLFVIALIVAGVSTILLPFCRTYQGMVSVTLFIGLSTGTCIPIVYLCTREIVGIQNFPTALCMLLSTTGFAGVVGGFFTGWIYDFSGSYDTAFFIMGSFFFTGSFFIVIPTVWLKYKKARMHSENNDVKVNSEEIGLSSPDTGGTAS